MLLQSHMFVAKCLCMMLVQFHSFITKCVQSKFVRSTSLSLKCTKQAFQPPQFFARHTEKDPVVHVGFQWIMELPK